MSASPESTQIHFQKHSFPFQPVILGRTGLAVAPVGFGGYRIHDSQPVHREALRLALQSGCNLVDTSSNYTDGGSEILIGQTVKEFVRDSIVVVTKAGYIQGENKKIAEQKEEEGEAFPEIVKLGDDLWHCIHPRFLEDQITRSLKRLQLDRIDIFLLHNPEYFLKISNDHSEYYRRIEQAFRHLEQEVERGRISWYGISSNTFPGPKTASDYTSLETVLEVAETIREDHHFAVIQFPFNLFESGAATEENNSGRTLLEFAQEKNIGTLINRPLNAFAGGQTPIRLANFPPHDPEAAEIRFQKALGAALELETRFPAESGVAISSIAWGHILRQNLERIANLEAWKPLLEFRIRPSLADALAELEGRPETQGWAHQYRAAAETLLDSMTIYLESRAASESIAIHQTLAQACPSLRTRETLSQKAIRTYRSLPGVHCVLVGMRKPAYVRDVMKLDSRFSPDEAFKALEALASQPSA